MSGEEHKTTDDGGLLDLPLGGVEEPTEPTPEPEPTPEKRQAKEPWKAPVWLLLLLVFLGALATYLLKPVPAVVGFQPALLDFGEVRVGQASEILELELENLGERDFLLSGVAVVGDAAEDFTFDAAACQGLEVAEAMSCPLLMRFSPRAPGPRRAELELAGEAVNNPQRVPLAGHGLAPQMRFDRPGLDFGSLALGTSSAPLSVELTNTGSAGLEIGEVELAGLGAADFFLGRDGCSRRTLAPDDSCGLEVGFVPTTGGERRATLQIASDALEGTAELPLVGEALLEPRLALDRQKIDFGDVLVERQSPAELVIVSNEGTAPLEIRGLSVEGSEAAASESGFDVVAEGCTAGALPPEGSCSLSVVFAPGTTGPAQALLRVAEAGGQAIAVPLAGRGVEPAAFFEPLSSRFGEVPVGSASPPTEVRLANAGTGPLEVDTLRLGGADARAFEIVREDCSRARLESGEGCAVEVRFVPPSDGEKRAELVFEHSAGKGLDRLPLVGLGAVGQLVADRSRVEFRGVRATTSREETLLLTNGGRAALRVSGAFVDGGGRRAFRVAGQGCENRTLRPGQGCEIRLRFTPQNAGEHRATLRVGHDAGEPLSVEIDARALPAPEPEIALEPEELDFGSLALGERGPVKTLTIRNPGSAPLALRELRLGGGGAGDFRIVPGSCADRVAPGASCTVGLRFSPTAEGRREAILVLRHNAELRSNSVGLVGYGSIPPPPLPAPPPPL